MADDLKSCPFCGGKAELIKRAYEDNTGYALVSCKACGNMTKQFYKSLDFCAVDEAIKSWNRRPNDE